MEQLLAEGVQYIVSSLHLDMETYVWCFVSIDVHARVEMEPMYKDHIQGNDLFSSRATY
jgi:hypothetical protein